MRAAQQLWSDELAAVWRFGVFWGDACGRVGGGATGREIGVASGKAARVVEERPAMVQTLLVILDCFHLELRCDLR